MPQPASGEPHRRGRWIALSVALLVTIAPALLGSCNSTVEEMRIRVDKSETGAFLVRITSPLGEEERDDILENSSAYEDFKRYTEDISRCGISDRIYQQPEVVRLDLRATFEDVDNLNSMLNCAAMQAFREPEAEFYRNSGFFWNSYSTSFSITQETSICGSQDDCPMVLPRTLVLNVPGSVSSILNRSDLVGITATHRKADEDTVEIQVRPDPNYAAINQQYFSGRREDTRRDVLRYTISSRELNNGTIFTVGGLIFSGIAIPLVKWIFSRRRDDPKPPATKRRRRARKSRSPNS